MKVGTIFAFCILGISTTAAADAGDDFSNNLFSDIAPYVSSVPYFSFFSLFSFSLAECNRDSNFENRLLALFGEQFAKQFMSGSCK